MHEDEHGCIGCKFQPWLLLLLLLLLLFVLCVVSAWLVFEACLCCVVWPTNQSK